LTRGIGTKPYTTFLKSIASSRGEWKADIATMGRIEQLAQTNRSINNSLKNIKEKEHTTRAFPKLNNLFVRPSRFVDNDYHIKNTNAGFSINDGGRHFCH